MQRVVHEYRNKSRIFNMLEGIYAYVSDTDYMFDDILWLDESFEPLCDILQEHLLIFRKPEIKPFQLPEIDNFCDTVNEITVCLSGGKDSAAVAYYYKKLGYKVHLYHATGVNKAYGDEKKAAQRIADYLGCDLFIDKILLSGTHQFIEHPLKNYVIANGALHYALAKGYAPVLAFGNFSKSILDMNEFEVCGGDCIEMWEAYEKIIKTVLPDFRMEIPLETNADTFDLLSEDWELFSMSVSCMSPFRFREHWKHRTEEKYNLRLFENRCGCCWKCIIEVLWLMDFDKMEYHEEYYLYGIGILAKTIYKETGVKEESIQSIWDNYMFYPIEESKAYDILCKGSLKYKSVDKAADIIRNEEM